MKSAPLNLIIVALLSTAACSCLAFENNAIGDSKATDKMVQAALELVKADPLPFSFEVIVLHKYLYGWTSIEHDGIRRILIVNKGDRENLRTLKHEIMHLRQLARGDNPNTEACEIEARKAEDK
jgi:hypothetical protein